MNRPRLASRCRVYSGTNVVKTFSSTNGLAGTNAGLNTVAWDGSMDATTSAPQGTYTVSVTAAAAGYDTWTNITDDSANFSVAVPRGIAVNQNSNSPYYGRVFVANAGPPFGIYKFNADGSPGDEGGFTPWVGGSAINYSPWKIANSRDDRVYVDDFSSDGEVYAFDQTVSTNCLQVAIDSDNYPLTDLNPQLSGLAVTGSGTNTQIWMTDESVSGSAGVILWAAATNGIAETNDTGTVVAPVETNCALSTLPYDLDVDTNGNLYVIQLLGTNNISQVPLIDFPPFQGVAETNTNWAVGSGDPTLVDAYGIAVDPTATLLAVAVRGPGDGETNETGFLNLYTATNGAFITNLDQTAGDAYYDAAWDNVGNLYVCDGTAQVWRAYSPPGTNQSTTYGVPFIQAYKSLLPPVLTTPSRNKITSISPCSAKATSPTSSSTPVT